jgi:hypothetical protein
MPRTLDSPRLRMRFSIGRVDDVSLTRNESHYLIKGRTVSTAR